MEYSVRLFTLYLDVVKKLGSGYTEKSEISIVNFYNTAGIAITIFGNQQAQIFPIPSFTYHKVLRNGV